MAVHGCSCNSHSTVVLPRTGSPVSPIGVCADAPSEHQHQCVQYSIFSSIALTMQQLAGPSTAHCKRLSGSASHTQPCSHRHFKPFTGSRSPRGSVSATNKDSSSPTATKRQLFLSGSAAAAVLAAWQVQPAQAQSLDDDFTVTPSGLKILDVRAGEGTSPQPGDRVAVHWSGYTKGYQVRLEMYCRSLNESRFKVCMTWNCGTSCRVQL